MTDAFIRFAIVAAVCAGVIMLGLYLKFGTGLATRLVGLMTLGTLLACGSAFYLGLTGGDLLAQSLSALIAGPLVFWIFFSAYRHVVKQMDHLSNQLVANTAQLAATAKEAAEAAAQQAAAVTEVSATVTELTQTSRVAAESAQQVAQHGERAADQGAQGKEAIARTQQVLTLITQVSEIVEVVSGLADQSNFLAVNAGIEAAKAGEHGRGFGVVASEVRSLAEQSKLATARIKKALVGTEEGRRALDSVHNVVSDLALLLEESSDRARHISASSNQQAAGIRQIADAMSNMSLASQSIASAAHQLESAISDLELVAKQARKYVAGNRALVA